MSTTLAKSILIALAIVPSAAGAATAPRATQHEQSRSIDPAALAALDRMGAFLRTQRSFTVRTTTETDYVLDNGQKVRRWGHGRLDVQRPNRLRAETISDSDRKYRQVFYDGSTFTIFAPRVGYYATVPAPSTILQLADMLEDRYALPLPLVDLFRWGTPESDKDQITAATYVGTARIDGVDTDQYAFRQPGLDWQIWIQRGSQPLPRKLVLTTTDDPARPEHAIELTWDLNATQPCSTFTFVPPKDARRISIAEVPPPETAYR